MRGASQQPLLKVDALHRSIDKLYVISVIADVVYQIEHEVFFQCNIYSNVGPGTVLS